MKIKNLALAGLVLAQLSYPAFAAFGGGVSRGGGIEHGTSHEAHTAVSDALEVSPEVCSVAAPRKQVFYPMSAVRAQKFGLNEQEMRSYNKHLSAFNRFAAQAEIAARDHREIQKDPSLFWKACASDLIDRAALSAIVKISEQSDAT